MSEKPRCLSLPKFPVASSLWPLKTRSVQEKQLLLNWTLNGGAACHPCFESVSVLHYCLVLHLSEFYSWISRSLRSHLSNICVNGKRNTLFLLKDVDHSEIPAHAPHCNQYAAIHASIWTSGTPKACSTIELCKTLDTISNLYHTAIQTMSERNDLSRSPIFACCWMVCWGLAIVETHTGTTWVPSSEDKALGLSMLLSKVCKDYRVWLDSTWYTTCALIWRELPITKHTTVQTQLQSGQHWPAHL